MSKIGVLHGRDTSAKEVVTKLIELLGHTPFDFSDALANHRGPRYTHAIVDTLMNSVEAFVVLFTPDEEGRLSFALRNGPKDAQFFDRLRPNVAYEYGLAVAKKPDKVIEISFGFQFGDVPSDQLGVHPKMFASVPQLAKDLADWMCANELGANEAHGLDFGSLKYHPPQPPFEDTSPPFEFIADPLQDLRGQERGEVPEATRRTYQSHGYEIHLDYVSNRTAWEREGYRPLVHKDEALRSYFYLWMDRSHNGAKSVFLARRK